MSETVQTAIAHIRAGDREAGARLLMEALRADPRDENAWLWLSALALNPESAATAARIDATASGRQVRSGLACFEQLQLRQADTRFDGSLVPPAARG